VFWLGTLFSFLGMQMQVVARGYLAYDLTDKNSALGGVMIAFGLPQLVLGLWGGVLADRIPKRNLLMVCQAVVAANSLWIAAMIIGDGIEYWMLVVAGAVQGAGFAFIGPARQAFISDLVDRDTVGNAVVLQQLSMNSSRVIGPSVAGVFIAVPLIGMGGVYLLTTVGFVITMVTIFRLPPGNPRAGAQSASPTADLIDGLRYVKQRPSLLLLILTSFAVIMVGFPYQSFLPSVAKDVYGTGAGGLGVLQSFAAVGAVGATVLVATFAQNKRAWALQPVLAALFGVAMVFFGLASSLWTGMVAILAVGALASAYQGVNNALTMQVTDGPYQGRVQSISMLSWSLFGLFSLPIGYVADAIGIRQTLALMGALVVLAVLALQLYARAIGADADRRMRSARPAGETRSPAGGS